jgi:glycerol kinase
MSNYIGAIDQGTTSTRFMVFDRFGRIVAISALNFSRGKPRQLLQLAMDGVVHVAI